MDIRTKDLIRYFAFTFAFSWILWLPFVLTGFGLYDMTPTLEGLLMPAIMLGAFAPLISVLVILKGSKEPHAIRNFFKRAFDFKIKPKYIVLAFLAPFLVVLIAHYSTIWFNIDTLPDNLFPDNLNISPFILAIPYFILMLTLGGGQEEFGWRAYAQVPMQNRFGIIKGSMLLGLIWGVWHLPLWFIPGEGHEYYSFFAFVLFTISFSLMIGIIYNASGKKFIVAWIIHAMSNFAIPFFPVLFLEDVPQPGYWVFVAVNIIFSFGLVIWYQKTHQGQPEVA